MITSACGADLAEEADTMSNILKHDPQAWREGFKAGQWDDTNACPYPAGTAAALSWQNGYLEGRVRALKKAAGRKPGPS
jgi:hypothetical protein